MFWLFHFVRGKVSLAWSGLDAEPETTFLMHISNNQSLLPLSRPVLSCRTCTVHWACRSSRRGRRCRAESSCRPHIPPLGGSQTSGAHTGCTRGAQSAEGRYSHRSPVHITSCRSYRLEERREGTQSVRENQDRQEGGKGRAETVVELWLQLIIRHSRLQLGNPQ